MSRVRAQICVASAGLILMSVPAHAGLFDWLKRGKECEACQQEAACAPSPTEGCTSVEPCCEPRDKSKPESTELDPESTPVGQPTRPVTFAQPAPTGEVTGARSSFELPSFRMTLPRIEMETPNFRLNGGARVRRNPQMEIDRATAGVSNGAPLIHGPLMGAGLQGTRESAPVKGKPESAEGDGGQKESASGCTPCSTTKVQSEEVRELALHVKELQGLVLQLAEQKAAEQRALDQQANGQQAITEPSETFESDQPAPEVSYVPRKAKVVSTTRQAATTRTAKNSPTRESLAASDRLQKLQEILEEKQAEMEALQAEQEEVEAAEREEIKAEERRLAARKKQLEADRVARLRSRMGRESVTEEPIASRASMIERMNYEDEAVEEQTPEPVAPKQLMPKPSRLKAVPTSSIRRNPSEWHEAEER